jgi:hypothetical protein
MNATVSERLYGGVALEGYEYKDKVCIGPKTCMNGFKYFLISSAKGVNGYAGIREPVDGILGMCRGLPPKS